MASSEFPRHYDVIVLGTGLVESLVAAALARAGRQVLHLDRNDYYGGAAAVHSLEAMRRWAADQRIGFCRIKPEPPTASDDECGSNNLVGMSLADDSIDNVEEVICTDVESSAPVASTADRRLPSEPTTEDVVAGGSGATQSVSASSSAHAVVCSTSEPPASATGAAGAADMRQDPGRADGESGSGAAASAHGLVSAAAPAPEGSTPAPSACLWTLDRLLAHSRQFSIDLSPKVLYCNGDMVQLLVSSSVSRYCEFQAVTRILSLVTGGGSGKEATAAASNGCSIAPQFQQVPCGRSDVFNSRSLSLVEKRILTKLLTDSTLLASTSTEPTTGGLPSAEATAAGSTEPPEGTYYDFLRKKGCSAHLVHLLLNSVAMVPQNAGANEALANTRKFLASAGHYGATPFLWPMYGGELSQAFCRVCAVFGGTYVLGRTAQSLVVDENNSYCSIVCNEGVRLQSRHLVVDSSYVPRQMVASGKVLRRTSRAILVTDRSVLPAADGDEVSILALPASVCGVEDPSAAPVVLLELPSRTAACPKGLYLVHLTCTSRLETARQDFEAIVTKLFKFGNSQPGCSDATSLPRVLWALFFNQRDFTDHAGCDQSIATSDSNATPSYCGQCCQLPHNVYVCDGLGSEFDYDAAVLRAKALFEKLCPGEDFLPPPQDDSAPCVNEEGDSSCADPEAGEQATPVDDTAQLLPAQPGSTEKDETSSAIPAVVQQQQLNS